MNHEERIAKLQTEMEKYEGPDRFYRTYSSELLACRGDAQIRSWYEENGRVSMLDADDLCGVTAFASMAVGPVLEIGTYVGGTTVAIGRGTSAPGSRIVCMEKGGRHPSHPRLPSADILADWRANIEKAGLAGRTVMIEGNYGAEKNQDAAAEAAGEAFGFMFVDADGQFDRAFNPLSKYLAKNALVMIDDYASRFYTDKAPLTKPVVDKLCAEGILMQWGLLSGQTWFGEVGPAFSEFVAEDAFVARLDLHAESPPGSEFETYVVELPEYELLADGVGRSDSPLILLEEGQSPGLPHLAFSDIGKYPGSFSHYRSQLAFSTRDGSDPRTNNRRYEIVVGTKRRRMILG